MRMSQKGSRCLLRNAGRFSQEKKHAMQAHDIGNGGVLRQTVCKASIGVLASMGIVAMFQPLGEAAAVNNVMNDIPVSLEVLRNERDRIHDFYEAKRNAKEAADALAQAEQDLQTARQDKQDAEEGLAEAQKNLENARLNLQKISQDLAKAQLESAQRTREAIAAQQAVADFAPQVWAQETVVQSVQERKQAVQADYEQLGQELGYLRSERSDLEERIRKAWDSVGYAQNRMGDVMAMVNRTKAIVPEQAAKEEEWQAYDSQMAELESEVDSAESLLDELNGQLDALQEQREAAEEAEQTARDLVKDLQEQKADDEQELKESEQYVAETKKWNEDATRELESAEENLTTIRDWKSKADYELDHFGEGKGFSTGFEYYNWHGAGLSGHQLYQPIEFYASEKRWELSISTGWLTSHTGMPKGDVSGWTDTELGLTFKNDHKVNDIHYTLNINVPTGKENVHQNAMMADNLARFSAFNEGWQFTPGVEATHRFTERDSLTGRLAYSIRRDYSYLIDYLDSSDQLHENLQENISPHNRFQQELEYRHIGDAQQLALKLTHVNATGARYRIPYESGRNEDGEDWIVQVFGSTAINDRNTLHYYAIGNYQAADIGGTHRYYGGLGWTYRFDQKQSGYILLNFGETHGLAYNWRVNKWVADRHMKAVVLGYDYRLNERSELRTKLERYIINGSESDSYHGWKVSLMWNKSF